MIQQIYIISVCDEDGYYIPVIAADSIELAETALKEWRNKNQGCHWTDAEMGDWVPLIKE